MKIYIVTEGSYSDYSIVAVYRDKTKAEKHVELLNRGSRFTYAEVEEYETSNNEPCAYYHAYVHHNLATGEDVVVSGQFTNIFAYKPPVQVVVDKQGRVSGTAYATSPEKAKKILQDAIAQAKAEREGI